MSGNGWARRPFFEELDFRPTPIGALSLRRRYDPAFDAEVYEIKLGEDFLMTSQFTASEIALAQLAMAQLPETALDIAVGGLGLGYTAKAVLDERRVRSLIVIELFEAVIDWHRSGLVPLGETLTADPRCRLLQEDFFMAMISRQGLDPDVADRKFHAVLVDIDHSPSELLDGGNAGFYTVGRLRTVADRLFEGGIFGLWSNAPPDEEIVTLLQGAFGRAWAERIVFDNPAQGIRFTQTVYLAARATDAGSAE